MMPIPPTAVPWCGCWRDNDVPGRAAARPNHRALPARRPDRRRKLHHLRRQGPAAHAQSGDIVIVDNSTVAEIRSYASSSGAQAIPAWRNIRPTLTRSNRSSQSSSISYAKPPREPSKPSSLPSANFSARLPKSNAPTVSKTQDIHQN